MTLKKKLTALNKSIIIQSDKIYGAFKTTKSKKKKKKNSYNETGLFKEAFCVTSPSILG